VNALVAGLIIAILLPDSLSNGEPIEAEWLFCTVYRAENGQPVGSRPVAAAIGSPGAWTSTVARGKQGCFIASCWSLLPEQGKCSESVMSEQSCSAGFDP
jgi:hypothetical protein